MYTPPSQDTTGCRTEQSKAEPREESGPRACLSPPTPLVHVLRHVEGFLNFTDHEDAGEHLLQLFFWDWLGRVPDGAVGRHHGLGGQVEGVVATFSGLWTEAERRTFSQTLAKDLFVLHKTTEEVNTLLSAFIGNDKTLIGSKCPSLRQRLAKSKKYS